MEIVIAGQYKILKKIGDGSFGQIYEAVSTKKGHHFAIKLENCQSKHQQLLHEAKILTSLLGNDSVTDKGVPNLYAKGKQGQYNYMVIDLLGPSLQNLFNRCGEVFSLKTTLMLADQMLKRIEYVHSKGYVHRDIKPQNFLITNKKDRKIYLIDFGLSKKYLKDGKHIPYADGRSMIGTIRYASLNLHYGIEPTRRDDLESWFYCLCYFLQGELPWQNQKAPNKKDKNQKIMGLKAQNRPEILCKDMPIQFCNMMKHIQGLKYDDKPNYELLKTEIRNCMKNKNLEYDFYFDWEAKKDSMNKFQTTGKI